MPPANAAAFAHVPALAGVLARASPGVLARAGPAFPGGGAWPGAAGVGDHAPAQGLRGRSGPAIPRGMRMRRGHSADHVAPLCRAPRVLVSWVLPLLLVVQPLAAPEPALGRCSGLVQETSLLSGARKTRFYEPCLIILKTVFLPRQARDTHRKS